VLGKSQYFMYTLQPSPHDPLWNEFLKRLSALDDDCRECGTLTSHAGACDLLVGRAGIEPATNGLRGQHNNALNHALVLPLFYNSQF
jgi:hypothetical protein